MQSYILYIYKLFIKIFNQPQTRAYAYQVHSLECFEHAGFSEHYILKIKQCANYKKLIVIKIAL